MICVSLGEPRFEALVESLGGLEMAEIRLDLARLSDARVRELFGRFGATLPLVATFRPGGVPEEERLRTLETAVRSGARYVDFELETPATFRAPLIRAARETGCRVIISHHDFERTPARAELERLVDDCRDAGADVVKVACFARSGADCARVLSLYDRPAGSIVAIGLGAIGSFTRIAALALGAPFTYASLRRGEETADGQIDLETLRRAVRALESAAGAGK